MIKDKDYTISTITGNPVLTYKGLITCFPLVIDISKNTFSYNGKEYTLIPVEEEEIKKHHARFEHHPLEVKEALLWNFSIKKTIFANNELIKRYDEIIEQITSKRNVEK
jgi:hypothetical protein